MGNIKLLKLMIGTDNHIRVYHNLKTNLGSHTAEIKPTPLQRATINALTEILREGRLLKQGELRVLGWNLFEVLLNNPIGEIIRNAVLAGKGFEDPQDPDRILRLELEFEDNEHRKSSDTQEFLSWPWEYLYDKDFGQGRFLSETTQLVLIRRLFLPDDERPFVIENGEKPKVLFVSASPQGLGAVQGDTILEEFSKEPIKSRINLLEPLLISAGEGFTIQTDKNIQPATWQAFRNIVQFKRPHIIHFVGHGRFERGQGEIAFVQDGQDPTPHWVNQADIANLLTSILDVRLVFLQACESGMVEKFEESGMVEKFDTGSYRAISGIASTLAANQIPAIVAMQYEIGNGVSNRFAEAFYSTLLNDKTLEEAVRQGREEILKRSWSIRRAFGLPVLYLRNSASSSILLSPSATGQSHNGAPKQQPEQQPVTLSAGLCPWCNLPYRAGVSRCGQCAQPFFCKVCGSSTIDMIKNNDNFCTNCIDRKTRLEKGEESLRYIPSQLVSDR